MSKRYPDWDIDGRDWPNRDASRFVEADTYRWHVQEMGPDTKDAPVCLLLHGTGAATHSWRELMPILAKTHHVVAMDLPGHGFTRPSHARRVTLPQMAQSIGVLVETLNLKPDMIVGHSAGAAIGIEISLQNGWTAPLIGLNPALMPFPGLAAKLFPTLAKVLFTNPFVSRIFARTARAPGQVDRFIPKATGSTIDRDGVALYHRLMIHSGHCDGAIRMMASWDLEALEKRLAEVSSPVLLIHGDCDKAIPRSAVQAASERISDCRFEELTKLGHLAHEENPERLAEMITAFASARPR